MIDALMSKWAFTSKFPNIFSLVMKKFIRTKVEIFAARTIQIGFNLYGPMIKLNLAFLSEHQDIVIRDFAIVLKHENGKEKVFEWRHLSQQLHRTISAADTKFCWREYFVLVIKLKQSNITERLVTCQDSVTDSERMRLVTNAARKMEYQQKNKTYDFDKFINSQEILELNDHIKESFDWSKGKYTITIKMNRCKPINIIGSSSFFSLVKFNVDHLEENKELILKSLSQLASQSHGHGIEWRILTLDLNPLNEIK